MEAVGRLAGGVAHDFNNLLRSSSATPSSLVGELDAMTPAERADVDGDPEGRRAAPPLLTRQLLAFSRQQLSSRASSISTTSSRDIEQDARRLIGEDVELDVAARPMLRP